MDSIGTFSSSSPSSPSTPGPSCQAGLLPAAATTTPGTGITCTGAFVNAGYYYEVKFPSFLSRNPPSAAGGNEPGTYFSGHFGPFSRQHRPDPNPIYAGKYLLNVIFNF